jgi:hypothetical protein
LCGNLGFCRISRFAVTWDLETYNPNPNPNPKMNKSIKILS